MKKVLIISSIFFGYQESVARAFKAKGYDVVIESYEGPVHPFKGITKWRHKFAFDKEKFKENNRLKYKKYIENKFDEYRPDIIFTYNGTILKDETLDYFRKNGAKVIVWMYDSVLRHDRKMCISHIDHADLFCCFEQSDVEYYEKQGKKAYFLPLACDTSVYFPIENTSKDIDILFVGTIYISEKRIKLLLKLAERYSDKKILFYGHYKPFYKNPISWFFRDKRHIFKNINIDPNVVNKLFSRTKIALNIHNKQTFNGANQRLFEASGAKAYQICDRNPYISSIFQNGEIGLYENEEELFALIDDALINDKSKQSQEAYDIIINSNTFDKRVEQMIEWLN